MAPQPNPAKFDGDFDKIVDGPDPYAIEVIVGDIADDDPDFDPYEAG